MSRILLNGTKDNIWSKGLPDPRQCITDISTGGPDAARLPGFQGYGCATTRR